MTMTKVKPNVEIEDGLKLIQRSYWLTKEASQQLGTIKDKVFSASDLSSVDLSAVLRGLIGYADNLRSTEGPEWKRLVKTIEGSKNPKKPGTISGSIR